MWVLSAFAGNNVLIVRKNPNRLKNQLDAAQNVPDLRDHLILSDVCSWQLAIHPLYKAGRNLVDFSLHPGDLER